MSEVDVMPLNKFLAHSGVTSRRNAVEFIKDGRVSVNGKEIFEPGFKVSDKDKVTVDEKPISTVKEMVYILLNKPTNTITSTEDPEGRQTVMDLVAGATSEKIYPIGRLDWNTTGTIILTNDGDLNQKLSHPKFEKSKIYAATLDRPITRKDFDRLASGVELEDGFIQPDRLAYIAPHIIEIKLHSGKNRIVRRMFEEIGYEVKKLDRSMFAGITVAGLSRGEWRLLTPEEINKLKGFN